MASTSQTVTIASSDSFMDDETAMKTEYMVKLKDKLRTTPDSLILPQNELENVMKYVSLKKGNEKQSMPLCLQSLNDTVLQLITQKNPTVINIRHKKRLLVQAEGNAYRMFVSLEDTFDIIWEAHKKHGHPEASDLFVIMQKSYLLPSFAVEYINKVCTTCLQEARPYVRCSLDLLSMNLNPDYAFTHIMIYEDLHSGYKHLRPLCVDSATTEISLSLLKIFMDFGTPQKVFASNAIFKVPLDEVKELAGLSSSAFHVINIEPNEVKLNSLVQRINTWMTDNDCKHWSLGCFIIQLELNNEVTAIGQKTPFSQIFRDLKETVFEDLDETVEKDTDNTVLFMESSNSDDEIVTVCPDEDPLLTEELLLVKEEEDPLAI